MAGLLDVAKGKLKLEKATLTARGSAPGGVGGALGAIMDFVGVNGVGAGQIKCRFNPEKITISTGAEWSSTPHRDGEAPPPEFIGSKPRTLQMELLFDDWDTLLMSSDLSSGPSLSKGVTKDINKLLSWTVPDRNSADNPRPPIVTFQWGSQVYFEAYLSSVTINYTLFRKDGTPARATANCTFTEVPNDAKTRATNPSSGGVTGRRSHRVVAGDSLASIAQRYYRRPAYWRGLAAVNDIDDPFKLGPGTEVTIPPAEDVEALS